MALWNFSWVIPNKLAGSSRPGGYRIDHDDYVLADLNELYSNGVRCLVSLHEMAPSFGDLCKRADLVWLDYPIADFSVPGDMEVFSKLLDDILRHMNNGRQVCIHCQAGIGRTGLVLACAVGVYYDLDAEKAISAVRTGRLALDTEEQEVFVYRFLDWKSGE